MESKSQYYDAYAAVMKITLRDNNASDEEKQYLQAFGKKLGITDSEYFEVIESYMEFDIVAPYTYNSRLENFYTLTTVVAEDHKMPHKDQVKWLGRMATAMGFNPSNVKYIVAKSLDLINAGKDMNAYKEGIKGINS
ncbi:hypothetical protein [uncultured Lacinutrix sp.]|uniref:hypothetical protein n=1 Tax=uncultured Lacinutrix sp. TaxID=574032 RepID=UPI00261B8F40|nr:hypothetical protein [uncultured Lacinutrix sp.]